MEPGGFAPKTLVTGRAVLVAHEDNWTFKYPPEIHKLNPHNIQEQKGRTK